MTTLRDEFEALMPEPAFKGLAPHPAWPFPKVAYYTADQLRKAMSDADQAATERAARKCLDLKPPDLDHCPSEYHRFDITTLACAAAIRGGEGRTG